MSNTYTQGIRHKLFMGHNEGFMVCGLPFLDIDSAERECARLKVEPSEKTLVLSPGRAAVSASSSFLEINRLMELIEVLTQEEQQKLDQLKQKRDAMASSDPFNASYDEIHEQIGVCQGLNRAWQVLLKRKYELLMCSYIFSTDEVST